MNATTWLIIAIVGFSLSGVALVVAVFMFIKMNIPAVIGDLTGKTVAREIQAMRDANAASGDKLHKSSRVNLNRGKLTEKVADSDKNDPTKKESRTSKRLDKTNSLHKEKITEAFSTNVNEVSIEERRATASSSERRKTDVLDERRKTEVLDRKEGTAVLGQTAVLDQTDVLSGERNGTTVLDGTDELVKKEVKPVAFKVTKTIIETHSDETI